MNRRYQRFVISRLSLQIARIDNTRLVSFRRLLPRYRCTSHARAFRHRVFTQTHAEHWREHSDRLFRELRKGRTVRVS